MVAGIVLAVVLTVLSAAILAKIGPVDQPRDRGLHAWSTATSGGLAVMAGVAGGLMMFIVTAFPPPGPGLAAWLLAGAFVLGLLASLDDVFGFRASWKLGVQIAVCAAFAVFVARVEALPVAPGVEIPLGVVIGVIGTTLWLVTAINAYNFMDGSDGLAVGVQSIGLFTLALANPARPVLAFILLAAAVANLVFLPFNHPGRRIFQGDAGVFFSGFLIAGATVLLATGPNPVGAFYLGVFVAAPFLTDALLTLLVRARAGEALFRPHNGHLYQQWRLRNGRSASALAWRAWGLTAVCALMGLGVNAFAAEWSLAVLGGLFAVLAAGWLWIRRRLPDEGEAADDQAVRPSE